MPGGHFLASMPQKRAIPVATSVLVPTLAAPKLKTQTVSFPSTEERTLRLPAHAPDQICRQPLQLEYYKTERN